MNIQKNPIFLKLQVYILQDNQKMNKIMIIMIKIMNTIINLGN